MLESNVAKIVTGTQIWSYLPIGTLPVDLEIKLDVTVPEQFIEVSEHRGHVLSLYNNYLFYPANVTSNHSNEDQGHDALYRYCSRQAI